MARAHVAIFGGTFDPVHNGHLRMATELTEHLHCSELRLIPAGIPPHREANQVAAHHRLAMLELAIEHEDKLRVDDCELKREGKSYTIDTMQVLREQQPKDVLTFCMGMDAFVSINTWQRWQEMLDYVNIVVITRPGFYLPREGDVHDWWEQHVVDSAAKLAKSTHGKLLSLELTPLSISSSDLRQRVTERKSIRYLVPKTVQHYIEQHQLYR